MADVPFHLRLVRAALRRVNANLSRRHEARAAGKTGVADRQIPGFAEATAALRGVALEDPDSRTYLEKHLSRLARTLTLVPQGGGGRALELGCYMQITPLLHSSRGYAEVRGAAYGPLGGKVLKTAASREGIFQCELDLFDVERDRFPYPDDHFDLVLGCELIEHMLSDPMHLLLECRRVLKEGGRLLLTTPNVASLTSVWRTLHGYDNPQIYYQYSRPKDGKQPEIPHVREYTAFEVANAVRSAGFQVEHLITEPIAEFASHQTMWDFLEEHGFNTSHRGEQTYCLAVKRSALPLDRYPLFLYV